MLERFIDSKTSKRVQKKRDAGTGYLTKEKKAKTYYKPTPAQQKAAKD